MIFAARKKICDLGFLRQLYRKIDGTLGYRCAGEPVADFLRKGGELADTVGRKCLCNGLAATVGLGQQRGEGAEAALVTAGNELVDLARLFRAGGDTDTAAVVLYYLRGVVTGEAGLPIAAGAR
jgi:nitronate monooxygenase